jgi:hypothetical protein
MKDLLAVNREAIVDVSVACRASQMSMVVASMAWSCRVFSLTRSAKFLNLVR